MTPKPHIRSTLGPVSSQFIREFLGAGRSTFTLAEAAKVYGKDNHSTGKFLSELVKRKVLARIKSGVYLILQTGQENIQLSNWPVIADKLTDSNDYYISFYSAMRLHGMTTHPLLDVYITLTKRRLVKKINSITYHFIYCKPENVWGIRTIWVTRLDKVYVSDLERTLLDALERPELCGGIKEIVNGIWMKHKEIDQVKMSHYATRFHTKAAIKRLGFIFDMLDLASDYLKDSVASAKDYVLLDPKGKKEGKYSRKWHIQVNMNIEELKSNI